MSAQLYYLLEAAAAYDADNVAVPKSLHDVIAKPGKGSKSADKLAGMDAEDAATLRKICRSVPELDGCVEFFQGETLVGRSLL